VGCAVCCKVKDYASCLSIRIPKAAPGHLPPEASRFCEPIQDNKVNLWAIKTFGEHAVIQ